MTTDHLGTQCSPPTRLTCSVSPPTATKTRACASQAEIDKCCRTERTENGGRGISAGVPLSLTCCCTPFNRSVVNSNYTCTQPWQNTTNSTQANDIGSCSRKDHFNLLFCLLFSQPFSGKLLQVTPSPQWRLGVT